MRRAIIPFIFFVILISSCEKDVKNVNMPGFVQKLVINSFISPRDSVSFVQVGSNQKLYGLINEEETIGNVSAVISDGTNDLNLKRINEGFVFRREEMTLEEGKTYRLIVTSDKGLKAEASATIPFRRPVKIEIDTARKFYDYGEGMEWTELTAEYYITDYPGEDNYYAFACKQVLYNSEYTYYPYHIQFYSINSSVFNDKGKDGEKILVSSISYMDPSHEDSSELVIYILNTDKDYYTYHHSLDNYSGGQDPFTEISPAYSNIEGGLGIFASYVVDSLVFKVK